jgi:hypothetical protein
LIVHGIDHDHDVVPAHERGHDHDHGHDHGRRPTADVIADFPRPRASGNWL